VPACESRLAEILAVELTLGLALDRLGHLAHVLLQVGGQDVPLGVGGVLLDLEGHGAATGVVLDANSLEVSETGVLERVLVHEVVRLGGELKAIALHEEAVCLPSESPEEVRGCHGKHISRMYQFIETPTFFKS